MKDNLWWSNVDVSVNAVKAVQNSVLCDKNALFCYEDKLPWRDEFYEILRQEFSEISSQKTLEFLSAKSGTDPGELVFDKLCPRAVRDEYWPSVSRAVFLAEQENILLNQRIVWVYDVAEKNLSKWLKFVDEYTRNAKGEHAIFVIEFSSSELTADIPVTFEKVTYKPGGFDRYIYCLSKLSGIATSFTLKQYMAELACYIGEDDVELCGRLASYGESLYKDARSCVDEILKTKHSDGTPFRQISEEEVNSFILMAQIKIVFPELERFRIEYIKASEEKIKKHLPIKSSFNEVLAEPEELEFSDLCKVTRMFKVDFSDEEHATMIKYKNYRNLLAHNTHIPYIDIENIVNG